MRRNKNLVAILLAGTLAASLAVPVSASETVESGQLVTSSTEQETAATQTEAAANDYIVFLPKEEGVEYEYDSSHMSESYSTSDYTVLLYRPGETVSFQVTSEKDFTVEDVLQGTEFTDASILDNGMVTFTMPQVDLCCDFTMEEETEDETDSGTEEPGEPGTFKIKLGKGLSGKCTMVNDSELEIKAGDSYKGNDMVDIIHITSEDGLDKQPTITVLRNGEKVEDTSGIVINKGLSKGTFVIDFKNGLSLEKDSYVVKVTTNNAEIDEETEGTDEAGLDGSETETGDTVPYGNPDTEADTTSEVESETEVGPSGLAAAAGDAGNTDTGNNGQATAQETNGTTGGYGMDTPVTGTDAYSDGQADLQTDIPATAQTDALTDSTSDIQASIPADMEQETGMEGQNTEYANADGTTAAQGETMSELGVVGDDYQSDNAVSAFVSGFADTVRETATAVNITVTNNIPGIPLVIKNADGTIQTVNESSYSTEDEIKTIEFIGEMLYAPQITVLKNGGELTEEDSIIIDQRYLENGNLYLEIQSGEEILPGNYEIQIG